MKEKGIVYFNNHSSGIIEKMADNTFSFKYENAKDDVSLTLPRSQQIYNSDELFPFFDGLIPEGWLLNLTQKNWKIPKNDRMTLLLKTCHDCIGAVHILESNSQTNSLKNLTDVKNIKLINSYKSTFPINKFKAKRCLVCMETLNKNEDLYHKKCALRLFGFQETPVVDVRLDDLEKLALLQINQHLTLTGVQKKLSLSATQIDNIERLTVVGLEGNFILKPSTEEYPEMAELEHICMKLAELVNLKVAECGLVYLQSGEIAYITKRFDRINKQKIQVEDFCQLSEKLTEKKYNSSSESLGKIIDKYSHQPLDDKLTLFQIILFSFWIGNSDMHLKNFSLWRDPKNGLIRFSPGYDFLSTRLLISEKEDPEELALSVDGRKNKIYWKNFLAFGNNLKIQQKVLERVRDKMLHSLDQAEEMISKCFLSDAMKTELIKLIRERSKRIE